MLNDPLMDRCLVLEYSYVSAVVRGLDGSRRRRRRAVAGPSPGCVEFERATSRKRFWRVGEAVDDQEG